MPVGMQPPSVAEIEEPKPKAKPRPKRKPAPRKRKPPVVEMSVTTAGGAPVDVKDFRKSRRRIPKGMIAVYFDDIADLIRCLRDGGYKGTYVLY